MKIVFMGSPDFAVPSLEALVEARFDVRLVVTQPDRRRRPRAQAAAHGGQGRGPGTRACRCWTSARASASG